MSDWQSEIRMPDQKKKESDPHWWNKVIAFVCATPLICLDVLFYILSLAWLRRTISYFSLLHGGHGGLYSKTMQSVAVGAATDPACLA